MIKPHGSDRLNPLYVDDAALQAEAETLPSIIITSAAAANAVMLGSGYFNPLTGYMDLADALSAANELKTTSGLFFPVPVVNRVESAEGIDIGQKLALRDPNVEGNPVLAVMTVQGIDNATDEQIATITQEVYGTQDPAHPGVAAWLAQGSCFLSG
ncbi:MAG: sulfate adenylyltransferase, partial [Gammaproteobacteria bacterium]